MLRRAGHQFRRSCRCLDDSVPLPAPRYTVLHAVFNRFGHKTVTNDKDIGNASNPTKNPPAEARGFLHRGLATHASSRFHAIRQRSRLPLRSCARLCKGRRARRARWFDVRCGGARPQRATHCRRVIFSPKPLQIRRRLAPPFPLQIRRRPAPPIRDPENAAC
jgi:hypothetical protein